MLLADQDTNVEVALSSLIQSSGACATEREIPCSMLSGPVVV